MSGAEEMVDDSSDGELESLKDEPPHEFAVIRQDVELEVSFREKRIDGRTEIVIATFDDKMEEVAFDARQCEVDLANITIQPVRVGEGGAYVDEPAKKATATYKDMYSLLDYPEYYCWTAEHYDVRQIRMRPLTRVRETEVPADARDAAGCTPVDGTLRVKLRPEEPREPTPNAPRRITLKSRSTSTISQVRIESAGAESGQRLKGQYRISIPFTTTHIRDGLHFVGVDEGDRRYPHLYTRHSVEPGTACCIFPCVDDHGSRCNWKVSIKCPRTLGDALRQPLATQTLQNGVVNGVPSKNGQARAGSTRDFALTEEDKLLEMTVVCSGILTDEIVDPEDDHKKIMTFEPENKVSVQKLGFAVGPFEHVDLWSEFRSEEDDEKLGASALKVHGYCLPGRADEVRNTCAALAAGADYFALTFSSYPFDSFKLCFLDDMIQDTVPLYSLAFISNRLLFPEDIIDTEVEVTRKIVHAAASQWSGIQLIPNTCRDTWIVVGIAYYMTDLFLKKLCGNNDYRFRMKTMADKVFEEDVGRPSLYDLGYYLHIGDFEMDFMALKAPIVLFILDKRLIKASSSTGLERIVSKVLRKAKIQDKENDSIISTESFRMACVKNNKSNMKLEPFWMQWIYGAGCPSFDVTQRFNKKRLCVEMTLRQIQGQRLGAQASEDGKEKKVADVPAFKKSEFLRLIKEANRHLKAGKPRAIFTGPMTIRIHEADGTPYEHIVEIRDDYTKGAKFEIPYNTKYKRLKRNRRQKERHITGVKADEDNPDEALVYCLGDVLQSHEEIGEWDLHDWPPETEKSMDQESYEWIRVDSDFEWALHLKTNMPAYMYVSQLQQDRDVVAQQDTMLYLTTFPMRPHPLIATFLVRTLMDQRYFHGIRTMAVDALPIHAGEGIKGQEHGLTHLQKAFQEMFCYPASYTPRPNDFADKKQYMVQSAIPLAMGRYRDATGRCPMIVRRFLLDQLLYNDNSNNVYSDHFYVAKLLEALATSLIPKQNPDEQEMGLDDDEDRLAEERAFLRDALTEIDRYRRMDEWTNTYHNIWTTAALDCKQRLMKAGVIPVKAIDFVQYLQDETYDLVRIKAFEALVDLGLMTEPCVLRLFLFCLSTDPSPFVRDRLIKALSTGLATLAFGEVPRANPVPASVVGEPQGEDGDLMVVEAKETDRMIELRRIEHDRKRHLPSALAALKTEIDEFYPDIEKDLQVAVWKAIDSPFLGRTEKITLLELCAIMFDKAQAWTIVLKYPKAWKSSRQAPGPREGRRLLMKFKSYHRTKPRGAAPEIEVVKPPEPPKRMISFSRPSAKPSPAGTPRSSIAVATVPESEGDSIVAVSARPTVERKPSIAIKPPPGAAGGDRTPKRPRDGEEPSPAPKRPKLLQDKGSSSGSERGDRKSKIVTLRSRRLSELFARSFFQAGNVAGSSITARTSVTPRVSASPTPTVRETGVAPAAAAGAAAAGGGAKPARKPLPSAAPSGASSPDPSPRPVVQLAKEDVAPSAPTAPTPVSSRPKIVLKRPGAS